MRAFFCAGAYPSVAFAFFGGTYAVGGEIHNKRTTMIKLIDNNDKTCYDSVARGCYKRTT